MKTKHFTLVVCPGCGHIIGLDKNQTGIVCSITRKLYPIEKSYKLGLKKIEETGEEIWVGVKDE